MHNSTYFIAPLEVWVFHERSVPNLALKQVMNILLNDGLKNRVQLSKVVGGQVVVLGQPLGLHAERTSGLTDVLIFDGDRKMLAGAILAAKTITIGQRNDLQ